MFVRPAKEKQIHEQFLNYSFKEEDGEFLPDKRVFEKFNSAEQYYLAENFNWDDGATVLNWIIDSKKCDKGTASLIFWRAEPDHYMKLTEETVGDFDREIFELLQKIIYKFRTNAFLKNRLKFDPTEEGYNVCIEPKHDIWSLPEELTTTSKGAKPISIGRIQNWIWVWQRKRRLRKREKRKQKLKKKNAT